MKTYIALLRGINVSGQKKIKMAELNLVLQDAGFKAVTTYIQSGNIAFKADQTDCSKLAYAIEKVIQSTFQFHVPTVVLTPSQLQNVYDENPFSDSTKFDPKKVYFAFLYTAPNRENIAHVCAHTFDNEQVQVASKMAYLYLGNGAGKAKLTTNYLEKKLQVTATARNFNTLVKLIEMSK